MACLSVASIGVQANHSNANVSQCTCSPITIEAYFNSERLVQHNRTRRPNGRTVGWCVLALQSMELSSPLAGAVNGRTFLACPTAEVEKNSRIPPSVFSVIGWPSLKIKKNRQSLTGNGSELWAGGRTPQKKVF